jgi:hypothetical protein
VVCIYSSFNLRGGWCVSSKKSHPGNLNPRTHLLTTEQEEAGHQCRSRRAWYIAPPPGVDSKNDQHVVSRYTAPPTPCEEDIISFQVKMSGVTVTKTCTLTLTKLICRIVRVFSRRMLAPAPVDLTCFSTTLFMKAIDRCPKCTHCMLSENNLSTDLQNASIMTLLYSHAITLCL